MNKSEIIIFIDRLKQEEHFSQTGSFPASFLELKEEEALVNEVHYQLEAYLTDDHLVLCFEASCNLQLPCKICNEFTPYSIETGKQTQLVPFEEIKKGIFDASPLIRESILLQLPLVIECEGQCPERASLSQYLNKSKKNLTQNPFQDLELS